MNLFLDTSVVLSASASAVGASREIVRRGARNRWALIVTPYVLHEVERNVTALDNTAGSAWIKLRWDLTIKHDVFTLGRPAVFGPAKDRPILFSALAWADVLLTVDREDFGALMEQPFYGLRILKPGSFLEEQRLAGSLKLNHQQFPDLLNQLLDIKRFLHELISTAFEQVVDFVLVDHAGDDHDLHVLEVRVLPDGLADDVAVDVGEHVVEDHQIGHELLGHDTRVVPRTGGLDFESAVTLQDVDKQFYNLGVVIDDEDFLFARIERVRRNPVVLHEGDEGIAWNAAKAGPRHTETLEPA